MGQRESCGLIVFGRREGDFKAYGFSDEEGRFLNHLFKEIHLPKGQQVTYEELLNFIKVKLETVERLKINMPSSLSMVWESELMPYLAKNSKGDHCKATFIVDIEAFFLLWQWAQQESDKRANEGGVCCGSRQKDRLLDKEKYFTHNENGVATLRCAPPMNKKLEAEDEELEFSTEVK